MDQRELNKLKYPIGHFKRPDTITKETIDAWIDQLEEYPAKLRALVSGFTEEQLNTPYRPGGWTIRQLLHHIPDSHHNSYTRFKWALTEDKPLIKAYDEAAWAELYDSKSAAVEHSLKHLEVIHTKLVFLLRGLSPAELKKEFIHPDSQQAVSLEENIGVYVWHGNHHYAHISNLKSREGW